MRGRPQQEEPRARRNYELKARLADPDAAHRACLALGAESGGLLRQLDTYFDVAHGWLKLREEPGEAAQLIAYLRPEEEAARESRFSIAGVPEPAPLTAVLEKNLGLRARVRKRRDLYLWEGIRIHLDDVESLGFFLELEAPLDQGSSPPEQKKRVRQLREALSIEETDLIGTSYCELLRTGSH